MRQLVFMGVRKLRWSEVPEPTLLEASDALVRPIAAARCDLDAAWLRYPVGPLLRAALAAHQADPACCPIGGNPPYAPPFAVGHECVAEIVALGQAVSGFAIGQRVIVPFQIACGQCANCARGFTSRCTAGPLPVTTYGFGPGAKLHGGVLAELVRVPYAGAMLVPLPANVDPNVVASASDNLVDGYRSVAPALAARPGERVLVVGGSAKSVGLYAAAIARALGAEVDYADTDRERLGIAERLGVRALPIAGARFGAFKPLPERYAISVDAASDAGGRGLELALRSLAVGGTCTAIGIYSRTRTPIPLMQMYLDGITLHTGITNARPIIPKVLELVARGALDPSPITTLLAPWADADRAFLEDTTKVVVSRAA